MTPYLLACASVLIIFLLIATIIFGYKIPLILISFCLIVAILLIGFTKLFEFLGF